MMLEQPEHPPGVTRSVDPDALAQLGRAIAKIGGDTAHITEAITGFIESLGPVEVDAVTPESRDYLIKSGSMSAEDLDATLAAVERGGSAIMLVRSFLKFVSHTLTLDEAIGLLDISEGEARQALADRTLYAFEVHGRLRFPLWQFDIGEPDRRLRGLADVIRAIPEDMHWLSVEGLMASPREDLYAVGRQTPVEWLRNGGSIDAVLELVSGEYLG